MTAVFTDALNLPDKAKVKLNGADIGQVESITATDFTAQVRMRIQSDVPLGEHSTAELRAATPLGDVFVAIRPDPSGRPDTRQLRDGDTIPLQSTTTAATVEEALDSVALVTNGGTIRHLVSLVNGAGSALEGRGVEVADLLKQSKVVITRLAARSAQIETAVQSMSNLATVLSQRQDTLNEAIAAGGPALAVIADNTAQLADLTDSVGRITDQINRFPSKQAGDTRSLAADVNHLAGQLNDIVIDPNLSLTQLNRLIGILMKVTNGTSAHLNVDATRIAIGSLPDLNYPGDPSFHIPDGTDYHAGIASLRYEWNLLLGRIFGPQR